LGRSNFELVKGDVRDRGVVRDAMDSVDAVMHLAALIDVERSVNDPLETHDVNVNGTLNLLCEAVRQDVRRFLFASSAAVYGEGDSSPLREDSPLRPLSPYAASKATAELYSGAFYRSYGLGTVILRYFNVYGSRQGHNPYAGVILKFLSNALSGKPLVVFGDGEQSRDFISVDDVVEATLLALESGDSAGDIFNICTGKPTTINQLAQIIKEANGRDLKTVHKGSRKGDVRKNYGDPNKAKKILGFKAEINLRKRLEFSMSGLH
jgi:UDP-glucose 4-epimerase